MSLAQEKCVACDQGGVRMSTEEIDKLKPQVPEWDVIEVEPGVLALERTFKFADFKTALQFVNRIGKAAEAVNHHPNICFTWGRVTVQWWTHKIKGLYRSDFIMAARTSELMYPRKDRHEARD